MEQAKSVVSIHTVDYGSIVVTLKGVLDDKKITRHKLSELTNINYAVIDRLYRKGAEIGRLDTDVLARICYVLDCEIADLIIYQRPIN